MTGGDVLMLVVCWFLVVVGVGIWAGLALLFSGWVWRSRLLGRFFQRLWAGSPPRKQGEEVNTQI